MLGYAPHELEDNIATWGRMVHPDDLAGATAQREKYLAGGREHYDVEYRLSGKDRVQRWIPARVWALCG